MKFLLTILCLCAVILVLAAARSSTPMGYLGVGGVTALMGSIWLTQRHRARGQVSW